MRPWIYAILLLCLLSPRARCGEAGNGNYGMTAVIRKAINDALVQPAFEQQRELVGLFRTNRAVLVELVERNDSDRRDVFTALLRTSKSLNVIAEQGADSLELPLANVEPPRETGLPAGVSPSAITNEHLRQQYERALQENREKGELYKLAVREQRDAMRLVRDCQLLLVEHCAAKQQWREEVAALIKAEDLPGQLAGQILGKLGVRESP